jgi:hypothetical protein
VMDMNMMVLVSGRERSLSEYEELFSAAGLRISSVIPTGTPMVIVEGMAIEVR